MRAPVGCWQDRPTVCLQQLPAHLAASLTPCLMAAGGHRGPVPLSSLKPPTPAGTPAFQALSRSDHHFFVSLLPRHDGVPHG